MGTDETELIRRWQGGDPAAFAALVRRWQQPMARFLYHMVQRNELIQDLCQEVFLRAYQAGPRYRENGRFSSWLYTIALNVARDASRGRQRESLPIDEEVLAARSLSPASSCEQQELAGIVRRAVAELPEPLRIVLVLRHYEGMNFEQISRLLGTPASTLKSRFAAALGRLREQLKSLAPSPFPLPPGEKERRGGGDAEETQS
jgi:RNA polymerase sigma-70 factor (ECF subfamily)